MHTIKIAPNSTSLISTDLQTMTVGTTLKIVSTNPPQKIECLHSCK